MRRIGVVMAVLASSAGAAHADDEVRDELGVNFVVGAESTSVHSGSLPGGQLELAHWEGRLGLVLEAGHVGDGSPPTSDGGNWFGGGVRAAIGQGRFAADRQVLALKTWLEVGAAREVWSLGEDGSLSRNRTHVGIGASAITDRPGGSWNFGVQFWFRMQRAYGPGSDMEDVPSPTNMIFGSGLLVSL